MTNPASPRHGFWCDGDHISREHARELRVQAGWTLLMLPDGNSYALCIVGGPHHQRHTAAVADRARRDALALFQEDE